MRNLQTLSSLVLTASLSTLAGCTTARLEYDRMTGTSYPQPVTVAGDEVNLTTIYWQGERLLTVVEDTTNIQPLTGTFNPLDPDQFDYITMAELNTVELANRNASITEVSYSCGLFSAFTCTRYNLYGLVANHYWEGDCGSACRDTSFLGLMYAGTTSGATNDRSAFVGFWKNSTVNSDNGKFLRSTAHEIGHAFNLNHCDGDGSTTIMNQTGVVGNTYSYEFSAPSLDHLQNHDDDVVWPGIGPRDYACPHTH